MAHGRITGWAPHLPERQLTNHDLAEMVETTDEWIRERSGIGARHVDGKVTEMSTAAGRDALSMAGVDPADVDLLRLPPVPRTSSFQPVPRWSRTTLGCRAGLST